MRLNKLPEEIDRMSYRDFAELVEVMRADNEIDRVKAHRGASK